MEDKGIPQLLEELLELGSWNLKAHKRAIVIKSEILRLDSARSEEVHRLRAGSNYIADDEIYPTAITFANGRVVRLVSEEGQSFLTVEPLSGEPEGRAESELECYCEDGETCETCKPSTPESVVSASPAQKCGIGCEPCGVCCQLLKGHDGSHQWNDHLWEGTSHLTAAQPVAANPPTQVDPTVNTKTATGSNCVTTERSTEGVASQGAAPLATPTITLTPMSNLPPEQMTGHSGTVNGAGLANPKVEEATEKICSKFWQLNNDHFRREIAAILGPFFTQVSQEILTDLMLELHHTLDMGGKLTLPIQIQMKKADEYLNGLVPKHAAPVTPVSGPLTQTRFAEFDDADHPFNQWWQKHGQYMMSGGGRKQFIWACRGWIAREQLAEGVEVTGDSMHEKPAVSGNGTEPPDALRKAVLKSVLELKHVASHNIEPPFEVHAAALQICMEREAEKLETALAGAASHNGQGWVSQLKKLRDEGWMVAVHNDYRQDGKHRTFWLFTRVGREGQFVKGEGETDADALQQITRQLASRALPAPPSEANGPQTKENK